MQIKCITCIVNWKWFHFWEKYRDLLQNRRKGKRKDIKKDREICCRECRAVLAGIILI